MIPFMRQHPVVGVNLNLTSTASLRLKPVPAERVEKLRVGRLVARRYPASARYGTGRVYRVNRFNPTHGVLVLQGNREAGARDGRSGAALLIEASKLHAMQPHAWRAATLTQLIISGLACVPH
jgi:hypothetical protein